MKKGGKKPSKVSLNIKKKNMVLAWYSINQG